MTSHIEIWREVQGTKGIYEVSSQGRIRKIVKQHTWSGYRTVSINRQNVLVHRLVCAAFCGDPNGFVVNHKNGIKTDNRAENLEPVTDSYNVLHAYELGLAPTGENSGQAKITERIVEEIRASKMPHKKVAAKFGISRTQISRIRRGESWKRASGETTSRFVPTEECGEYFRPSELFTFNGKTQTLTKWAKELSIKRATLAHRLFQHQWSPEEAFTRPATRVTNRKLTDEQILYIARSTETQRALGERFGVAQTQISRIRTGQRWRSITGLG